MKKNAKYGTYKSQIDKFVDTDIIKAIMRKALSIVFVVLFTSYAMLFAQSRGYEKAIEVNGGLPLDHYSRFSLGGSVINGYRINEHFFLGVLLGYEYFDALNNCVTDCSFVEKHLLKIGVRAKANISKGKVSPFLSIDAGYNKQVGGSSSYPATGLYLGPAFGVDFKLQEKQKIYVMLGCHVQKNSYKFEESEYGDVHTYVYTIGWAKVLAALLDLRVGFKF